MSDPRKLRHAFSIQHEYLTSIWLSIDKAGTGYTLTATSSPSYTSDTSSSFDITAGTATKLAFTTQPGGATGGSALSPQPKVSVEDALGNVVTSDSSTQVTVAIGSNPGGGTLSGTTTVTVSSGVATFTDLSIDKAGTGYNLTATSSPSYTSDTSNSFNITAGTADLIVDTNTTLEAGEYTFRNLNVTNNATLTLNSNPSLTGFQGVKINAQNITIDPGSSISSDGMGYGAGSGPGAGSGTFYSSGGGYGGKGGNDINGDLGGATYGSAEEPVDLGSGGGLNGGAGGGAIRLDISGTLTNNGLITANGANGSNTNYYGGGSGGSIYITTETLAGSGSFTANGGIATGGAPGGGGGGRIAIYYQTSSFTGTAQANGGTGGYQNGQDCTISMLAITTVYVKWNADGSNNGTSWASAYTDLQSALNSAVSGDQIWVAAGTYKPSVTVGGTGDRYRSFQMVNGVAIYGGFAGTETSRSQRNWATNVTTISGDIGVEGDNSDNCYHVISNQSGIDNTAVLDGFMITVGNANGAESGKFNFGGGILNYYSSPTITNCTLSGNSADNGGGMFNEGSSSAGSPTVTNCTFSDNNAAIDGGGMYNNNSSPTVTSCTFSGNSATEGGGILCKPNSSPTITNCIINNNSTSWSGGGIECDNDSSPTISNCTISDNSSIYGGGMQCNESSPMVINCIISDNTSTQGGGGINNDDASSTFINCTITGNNGPGGGLHSGDTKSSVTAVNSIIWGNTPCEVSVNPTCSLYITYSDVRGGTGTYWYGGGGIGTGCIDADPMLTADFHLNPGSPCIDTGSNSAVPPGVTTDFEGDQRIVDGNNDGNAIVDMGADEYTNN